MSDLEQNIKDFYQSKKLSEDALKRILDAGNAVREGGNQQSIPAKSVPNLIGFQWLKHYPHSVLLTLVASLVLSVSLLIYYPTKKTEALVYSEVAMNHNKQLDVEFRDNNYRTLAQAMTKLDFPLVVPHRLEDNYELIGGRYCSIQGNLAAQLKVKSAATGRIDTLYIVPLTRDLYKISAQTFIHNGINITLWHTDELFYALASDKLN